MTDDEIDASLRALTSVRFSAELNLAASAKAAWRIARGHPDVTRLSVAARASMIVAAKLARRVHEISRATVEDGYESPYDAELFGLLAALILAESPLASTTAEVAAGVRQTFLARTLAMDMKSAPATIA